jgi:hypothetical protein
MTTQPAMLGYVLVLPVGYFDVSGKVDVSHGEESESRTGRNPLRPVQPPSSLKQPEAVVTARDFGLAPFALASQAMVTRQLEA